MNNFTPAVHSLFYADSVVVLNRPIWPNVSNSPVTQVKDRSYSSTIFRCIATDENIVVAEIVFGDHYAERRRILYKKDYKFYVVNEQIARAVGMSTEEFNRLNSCCYCRRK